MKFFRDRSKWRLELSAIGLAASLGMQFLGFFVLGDATGWWLTGTLPLILPILLGDWKFRTAAGVVLACTLVLGWPIL